MRIAILLILLMLSVNLYGQDRKVTITGNPADSSIIKMKLRLEAKGIKVTVKDEKVGADDNPLLTMGDQAFRQRHKGQPLPPFTLKDVNGKLVRAEDLKGKRVHINFWSITCAPCIQEFPELNELKKKYGNSDWVFLAFAPEEKKKVENIVSKNPLAYTTIANAQDYYKLLGIGGYPKNFFVDRAGTIVEVTDGTNFDTDPKTGKPKPDNFRFYDRIMAAMQ